jgi:hypothetical protein
MTQPKRDSTREPAPDSLGSLNLPASESGKVPAAGETRLYSKSVSRRWIGAREGGASIDRGKGGDYESKTISLIWITLSRRRPMEEQGAPQLSTASSQSPHDQASLQNRTAQKGGRTAPRVVGQARLLSRSLLSAEQVALRLLIAFGLLVGLQVAVGYLGLRRMEKINASLDEILGQRWAKLQLAREALTYSNRNSRITMQVFLERDREAVAGLLAQRAENSEKVSKLLAELKPRCDSAEEKGLISAIENARGPYVTSYLQALHLLLAERKQAAATAVMLQKTTPALLNYHAVWDEFVRFQMEQVDVEARQNRVRYTSTRRLSLCMIVAVPAWRVPLRCTPEENSLWKPGLGSARKTKSRF